MNTILTGQTAAHAGAWSVIESASPRHPRGWRALFCIGIALLCPTVHAAVATGVAVPGFESYDRVIPALLEKWSIPGAAISVAIDGRIVFARGYGLAAIESGRPMQPDTRARVGSISKMVTAAAVLKLVDQGRLSLNDRVFPLLSWPTPIYQGAARDPRLDQITVAQALSHTGGWIASLAEIPSTGGQRGFDPVYLQRDVALYLGLVPPASAEVIARAIVGQPLQANPGTTYSYSNTGFVVLGRLIEHVTGRPYEDAVRALLAESGLTELRVGGGRQNELREDEACYYDYPGAVLMQSQFPDGQLVAQPYAYSMQTWDASGGWTMSAIDGVRLLLALEGNGSTPRLLPAGLVTAMRTPQLAGSGYGFGWVTTNAPLSADGGHIGSLAGSLAAALRTPDGRCHTMIVFNSRPNAADAFIAELLPALDAAAQSVTTPVHDFTATTLSWEAWARKYFRGVPVDPLADSDNDGVPNLVEFGAGLDPASADVIPPAAIGCEADGTPVVTYRRLILENPVTWTVEYTSEGSPWQLATAVPAVTLNSDGTLACAVRLPGASHARLRVRGAGAEAILDLPVPALPGARVLNLSARARVDRGENVLIAGFAIAGDQPRTVLIRGAGPAIGAIGVADALGNPQLKLFTGSRTLALSDDWGANAATIGATAARVGAFGFPARSADAGLLVTLKPGSYTAELSGVADGVGNGLLEIYEADRGSSQLVNVSTRSRVGGTAGELIVGFVVGGNEPRRILMRACGPSLRNFGVNEALADPLLRLLRQADGRELARNADWSHSTLSTEQELRDAMGQAGAFGWTAGSADAALVATLAPGAYTIMVNSAAANEGVVLAEVYQLP